MNQNIVFSLVFLFSTQILLAQSDFRVGFLVKKNGDTLRGKIDYRGDMLMKNTCRFRAQNSISVTDFTPDELMAFRFEDSKYFISKEWEGKKIFLEYLINAKVNIYYYRNGEGDHYLIEKEGERMSEFQKEEEIVVRNGVRYFQKRTKHINLLGYYMQDAPELVDKIKNVEKPEHESLIKIAKQYHAAVCKDKACVIYEKKHPIAKINPEIIAGILAVKSPDLRDGVTEDKFMVGGILANIWLPRSNEKLYFRTGIIYSSLTFTDGQKRGFYKIPLHLCYQVPTKIFIKPFASIGLLSPSYSAGVMLKITKKWHIGLQGWADYAPKNNIPVIPSELLYTMMMGNVYVKF